MKELKSKCMIKLLSRGLKRSKKTKQPSDGNMFNLIHERKRNGWHYQVEYVHDIRIRENPYVVVYAFKPTVGGGSPVADYYLLKEV